MARNIQHHIKKLEKLSLITCCSEVLPLLERTLKNVEPILSVDTKGVEPLMWQNDLTHDRLGVDNPNVRLTHGDLKRNASRFYEDYIVVGIMPKTDDKSQK